MYKHLIGDIGGTSADWVLLSRAEDQTYHTAGYNPASQSDSRLQALCDELSLHIGKNRNLKINYFGAGTNYPGAIEKITCALGAALNTSSIQVQSDLVGAAKALCGKNSGVVAILGTGSNVCYFDGNDISKEGVSLGFPLGDEGSGVDLGSELVRKYYYRQLPEEMRSDAASLFPKTHNDFLREYKASVAPNQLLASYTKLLATHRNHPFVVDLVKTAFRRFCACHLPLYQTYRKINFVGSIAFYFCSELEEVLAEFGHELGAIQRQPIEALASFYKQQNFGYV